MRVFSLAFIVQITRINCEQAKFIMFNFCSLNYSLLCQWLWLKLLQQELDLFMEFRNRARMCKDKNKASFSGCSQNNAFSLFYKWGGWDCLLPVDVNII